MKKFTEKFKFNPKRKLFVGVEREFFLLNSEGRIAPIAPAVLEKIPPSEAYSYELSACQLETKIGPCEIGQLKKELVKSEKELIRAEKKMGFRRSCCEVAPDDMPLDIFPDPTGRYQKITAGMPREIILAACRIIGTHVHIGMPDPETALKVYNRVIMHTDELCSLGDGSGGERLEIYKFMVPDFLPSSYSGWKEYHREAVKKGFEEDPRKCWHLIRISVHGTIEFRMFGTTADLDKIVLWAKRCHQLCEKNI